MSMENIRDLFLEDETFEDARQKFNTVLQRLFRSMIDTESNEGSITLKMDVSMQTEYIPNHDPDIKGESRCVRLPQFAYKVSRPDRKRENCYSDRKGCDRGNRNRCTVGGRIRLHIAFCHM